MKFASIQLQEVEATDIRLKLLCCQTTEEFGMETKLTLEVEDMAHLLQPSTPWDTDEIRWNRDEQVRVR